jgi:ATP-dependent helicase HrpA
MTVDTPPLSYPDELPITARRPDLLAAISAHQVVVVAGETGSGKTTQLPKLCLELGRGQGGAGGQMIGHTQPRRIAARAVSERIAEELGTEVGGRVGFAVRFTDQVGPTTQIKVMTDGILLAEIQGDPLLRRYDTLIIDEAHERSLTIDFLLGYLRQLLPRRPDLKLIITSATIDPDAFARHFAGPDGTPAPVIEVSGRTYPVEVRYRPLVEPVEPDDDAADQGADAPEDVVRDAIEAICEAVDELASEAPGDVLVFLSGEREIRDTADALQRHLQDGRTEVLPLYGRLSAAEQHRVFSPHTGRRVVLATNVAETSLTVPGIRYVVDPGTARISRYSQRTKVQRLPIEPVSQASADQRKGRCGRVADGICIRLYSEADFEARPRFTEPEILRTNLASVILRMASLGLGEVADFPFLEPPDARQVKDGVALLQELGAFDPAEPDPARRLTRLGRTLARLPVDPRLARMLTEADANACLDDVLVIVSALSVQDVRERPTDKQAQADQSHARFADSGSDFITLLNLWHYLLAQQEVLSSSAFRRMCIREFLHHQRVREWQDLHSQLRQVLRGAGLRSTGRSRGRRRPPEPAPSAEPADDPTDAEAPFLVQRTSGQRDGIHTSLLPGLLSQIGVKEGEGREYTGARGIRFMIQPGSALSRSTPRWVMVAELVETSRLWGRTAARIDPLWVERVADHLVRRSYSEPRWERKRASAVATERVTLYGIPVVPGRTVPFGRVDPELSRELFIRRALVEGDWRTNHRFFHENRRLLEDVGDLEDRTRRRDIMVDDDALFDFYDRRIPADVVSGAHFDAWWKQARRDRPDQLSFWTSMLVREEAPPVEAGAYPDTWRVNGLDLPVTYQFEPGSASDGVTVHVPLAALAGLADGAFDWQIPGLRPDLVTALIRALPKEVRKRLAPAPDHARGALLELDRLTGPAPVDEPLLPSLAAALQRRFGVEIPSGAWDLSQVPDHLRVTVEVTDDGRVLATGKDVAQLRERLRPQLRAAIAETVGAVVEAAVGAPRTRLTAWPEGDLPRSVEETRNGLSVSGFPALVDLGDAVEVQVLDTAADQRRAMRAGVRRLLLLAVPSPARSVLGRLDNATKLALASAPHTGASALFDDCLAGAVDAIVADLGGPVWERAGYERLLAGVRSALAERVTEVLQVTARILAAARQVDQGLRSSSSPALLASLADERAHLTALVHPGFVTEVGAARLPDLVRYLSAAQRRLERLPERYDRDRVDLATVARVQAEYDDLLASLPAARRADDDVTAIRWMIEELRVSLFGAGLRTAHPVSEQRILKAMDAL